MTGFELQTSGIGSDRSTNWATTTAQMCFVLKLVFILFNYELLLNFGQLENGVFLLLKLEHTFWILNKQKATQYYYNFYVLLRICQDLLSWAWGKLKSYNNLF